MVFSKRVISVLLVLCALTALCAVGASAVDEPSIIPSNHMSRADQYALYGWSVDPDYFIYYSTGNGTNLGTVNTVTWKKTYDGPCFGCVLVNSSISTIILYCPTSSTITSSSALSFVRTNWGSGSTFSALGDLPDIAYNNNHTFTGNKSYVLGDLPFLSTPFNSNSDFALTFFNIVGLSFSEPVPEPEPDPDAYNPIPDVYTSLTPSLYFTNYKSTGENSFTYLNRSFSEFPSPDYAWTTQFPDVILGAFYNDFSTNLEPLDSIAGQASVVFTDPLGVFTDFSLISSLSSYGVVPFSDVEIWLVNGSEPTLSGFQYFVCPSSWISTKLWRYPISQYSTEYVCNFQINLPEDYTQTVGFTPVNFFVRIYRSTAGAQGVGRPYDVWYDVTNFVIGVYDRPSSDPEDIPPVPYNPSFSDPSNPGQEVTNALDEEERRISESYNPDESMDSANSTFDLSALGSAFSRLADGIGYTGTSFSFKFPASGTVPFLNVSLWNETEIPFKQWIDALPVSLLYVVRFLAWLGLGFSFAHMIRKLISDLNGGDKD